MGVDGVELVNITRGALLHDIGKMAIPDVILLKPGKLTEDERLFDPKTSYICYDMLKRIDFLVPAIDIPHYHHEKWMHVTLDGSKGYVIPFFMMIMGNINGWYKKINPLQHIIGIYRMFLDQQAFIPL